MCNLKSAIVRLLERASDAQLRAIYQFVRRIVNENERE